MSDSYHLSVLEGGGEVRVVVVRLELIPNRRTHRRHELADLTMDARGTSAEEVLEHVMGALTNAADDAERRAAHLRRAAPRGVLDTIHEPRADFLFDASVDGGGWGGREDSAPKAPLVPPSEPQGR